MRKIRGFTLIEVMIAVAIIGILAAIAFPAYQDSVVKGNRASAKSFLMEVSQKEAQYLLDKRAYTADLAELGLTSATIPREVSNFYTVTVTLSGPPPGFTVTATPIPGKRQAADGALSLTNTGVRTPADKW